MNGPFTLFIFRRIAPTEVVNLSDISALYVTTRDDSGEGASTFPEGLVKDARGLPVARVSYNGHVWSRGDAGTLLYDPSDDGLFKAIADAARDDEPDPVKLDRVTDQFASAVVARAIRDS